MTFYVPRRRRSHRPAVFPARAHLKDLARRPIGRVTYARTLLHQQHLKWDWTITINVLIKSKNRRELGIFIEVFRIIKRAETLLLVFCKAVYVKPQQMDMKAV